MLDANRTEDQSTENLAAVLNLFQRVVNESVVLDNQVSPSPYHPCLSIDQIYLLDIAEIHPNIYLNYLMHFKTLPGSLVAGMFVLTNRYRYVHSTKFDYIWSSKSKEDVTFTYLG